MERRTPVFGRALLRLGRSYFVLVVPNFICTSISNIVQLFILFSVLLDLFLCVNIEINQGQSNVSSEAQRVRDIVSELL